MERWLWAGLGLSAVIILVLAVKLCLMRRSARELMDGFARRLETETNTLIGISGGDRTMRALAAEINRALRLLRRDRRRYQQGDRLVRETITGAAHDLRTPLTAMAGYLELLKREELSPAAAQYVALMENRVDAMTDLTGELFRYSVAALQEDEPPVSLALNGALEEALAAAYTALTRRGITPVVSMPETQVCRTLPKKALSRVLENLLENARKYAGDDLAVTLTESGTITFRNAAPGLTPVEVGQLFDRFYTVHSAAPHATGLGLSIARQLTEQMGGALTAGLEGDSLILTLHFPS